jgi:hypothetical protein
MVEEVVAFQLNVNAGRVVDTEIPAANHEAATDGAEQQA